MASNSISTLEKLKSFAASPCSSQDFEVISQHDEESAELVSIYDTSVTKNVLMLNRAYMLENIKVALYFS